MLAFFKPDSSTRIFSNLIVATYTYHAADPIISAGPYFLNQTINAGSAYVYGFEIAFQQQFTFFPGLLDRLGLSTNYGYTASQSRQRVVATGPSTKAAAVPIRAARRKAWLQPWSKCFSTRKGARRRKVEGTSSHPNQPLGLHTASQDQMKWERFNLRKVDEDRPFAADGPGRRRKRHGYVRL